MTATTDDNNLIQSLKTLKEIGAGITTLDSIHDLLATLNLVVQGAVRAVETGSEAGPSSAVIWLYDAKTHTFEPNSRVSAGESARALIDDFPRPDGLGLEAIRRQERVLSYEVNAPDLHPAKRSAGARTLVCFPLLIGHEAVGVLYVYRCDRRHFSEIELLTLDNFVYLAGLAIQRGRQSGGLTKALARKVREMEKLKWASQLINSRVNLDETLHEILYIGLDLTAAQYGSLALFDREQNLLVTKALAGSEVPPSSGTPLKVDRNSVVGMVGLTRQSVRISDLQNTAWRDIYRPLPVDRKMRSELAVPLLRADSSLEGVLNIESPQPQAFTQEDQQLLETLAAQAVIAIEEVRLLDAMQEIAARLLTVPVDDLLSLIVDRACELINLAAGAIWIVADSDWLVLRQSNDGRRPGERMPLLDSFAGQAIRLRQPITIDDVRLHPNFRSLNLAKEKGWISAIVVPLLHPNRIQAPVGCFSLYAAHLRDFSDWDKKLLTWLGNHAAIAIRDAERRDQLQQAQERQVMAETFAAIGDVGANLVHQLNNTFGAISVRVQGIEEKCAEALENWPYLAENLQEIAQSSQQAMAFVRDSVALLRLNPPQPTNLSGCVALALQRADPPETVKIVLTDLDDLPKVLAGQQQLEMVFYNLIVNAITAMQGKGELRIRGQNQGNKVGVVVADTGPGIPLSAREHIFELPQTTTAGGRASKKLGFGLWWVKTFINRFHGTITLDNEVGQGSRFTIWLPAIDASEELLS